MIKPDEVVEAGPIRLIRAGRLVLLENRETESQNAAKMQYLAEKYPGICAEIDELVRQIAEAVSRFDPPALLHRAYWENLGPNLGVASEIELGEKAVETRFILEYLQNMICALPPSAQIRNQISEVEWRTLTDDIKALCHKLQVDYFLTRTAWAKQNDPNYDDRVEDYAVRAQMHWLAVRGTRYLVHDLQHFKDVLSPHNEIFQTLFGIDIDKFLQALYKVFHAFTHGVKEAMEDLDRFRKATLTAMEESIAAGATESDPAVLLKTVITQKGWESWREKVVDNAVGFGLFDLNKLTGLPKNLLDALSWEPGEDQEFLSDGPYKGWPLRVPPIWRRPFLKVGGRHYCFDIYALTDHLYRIVQRMILRIKPEYKEEWNRRQKLVSESLPVDLLSHILPGAEVHRGVQYEWHTGEPPRKQWCETDAVLLYDDHLIVVEVKAGAFTHTPPSTDFPAYIRSLDQLLRSPAQQTIRFCEYLDSAPVVTIYDTSHRPIRDLRRSDYRHITRCCVTLDQLTDFAARAMALQEVGVHVGHHPVWPISIDDLRVFADIFCNPLVFCHFLDERAQAYSAGETQTDDELTHLGLYLAHNRYTLHAKGLANSSRGTRIQWGGYREKIDRYYAERLQSEGPVERPRQDIPPRLGEIIDVLAKSGAPGRCKAASWLLDMDGELRSNLAQEIEAALSEQLSSRRAKIVSAIGSNPTSIFCWIEGMIPPDTKLVRTHSLAQLRRAGETERLALALYLSSDLRVGEVHHTFLKPNDIRPEEMPEIRVYERRMVEKRFARILSARGQKIGRNEPCPCGSGKKYKRCCRLSV